MSIFDAPEKTTQQMADLLPDGRAWQKKNEESNTRKLIRSLSVAHNRVQQLIEVISIEFDILQSIDLLTDWETSVGLPDTCIASASTLEERRERVIALLRKKPIVTLQEFQDYVDNLWPEGNVIFYPGYEYYNFEYNLEMTFWGDINEKFVLVAELPISSNAFEYELEMTFEGGVDTTLLRCIIEKILPSNVVLIIEFRG